MSAQAIHTLASIAERIADDDTDGISCLTEQFERLLSEGSREVAIELIRIFATLLAHAHATRLRSFILEKLMQQAEQNSTNRSLQQRPEFAGALYEAYRAFDSIALSPAQTQDLLIPGLKWITKPEPGTDEKKSLLGDYEQELILKMVKELSPEKQKKKNFLEDLFD